MTKPDKVFYTAPARTAGGRSRARAPMLHKVTGILGLAVIVTSKGCHLDT
jgi:hypothetical protein